MLRLALAQQLALCDYDDGHDGLFSTLAMVGEDARYLDEAQTRSAYDAMLSVVLEGRSRRMIGVVDAIVRQHGNSAVDLITAELGWHLGLDVVAALAISAAYDNHATIEDGDGESVFTVSAWQPLPRSRVRLAPGVDWDSRGVLLHLPETLAVASVGRPLSQVVSHPVLDRHALTIAGCGPNDGRTLLMVGADETPIDVEALIAMRPGERVEPIELDDEKE